MEIICPIKLSDQHKTLLCALFKQSETEISVFQPGVLYSVTLAQPDKEPPKVVEFYLTHTIYKRPRENKPKKYRYDVIDEDRNNPFERGGTSLIYKIIGTFKVHNDSVIFDTHKNRLAKVEKHDAYNRACTQDAIDSIYNELQLANLAGSGHMKQPAWVSYDDRPLMKSYLTMRQRKGETIFDFINNERMRSPKHQLTTQQRIDMTLSLLTALQNMHKKGVIHRDIKLENIFYQFNKNKTTFIDFGFSKIKKGMDNNGKGTHGYIPPEFYLGEEADEKSDLFSLGVTLSLVWGGSDQSYDEIGNLLDNIRFHEPNFTSLLKHVRTDLFELEKALLRDWMKKITATDRDERLSVNDAISAFKTFNKLYKKNHPQKSENKLWFNLFKKRTPVNDDVMPSPTQKHKSL